MREAMLIIGHGTRDPEGIAECLALGRLLGARRAERTTEVAFLEFARPTIAEAAERLVTAGIDRVVCQPGMLFAAGHVKRDLPCALEQAASRWPAVELRLGPALDQHPDLLSLAELRWNEALAARPPCPGEQTMLLVAARGSSDAGAAAGAAEVARLLQARYGAGDATACFSGVATPLVPQAIEAASRRGFRRVVVQPYFLFTGVLVKQIHEWTRAAAAAHPELEMLATGHLGVHELLARVFEDRAAEAVPVIPVSPLAQADQSRVC